MTFKLGEVRAATDQDFKKFSEFCLDDTGWTLDYSKKSVRVLTRQNSESNFKIVKAQAHIPDVSAEQMYDVLHDPEYRTKWDRSQLASQDIGRIGLNADISYFAMYSPPPFQNRDFVLHRTWLLTTNFAAIFNHSVFHKDFPPRSGIIRGISYISGYLMVPTGSHSCTVYFVSHCDPGGNFPAWAVNKFTQIVAPSVIKRLHRTALAYPQWKATHNPNYKPWLFPEQFQLPLLDFSSMLDTPDFDIKKHVDETRNKEADFNNEVLDSL